MRWAYLSAGVGEYYRLGDGQGLEQVAEDVDFEVLLADIHVELLDTLQGELVTLHKNADWLVHELLGDLERLRRKSSREHTHLCK